MDKPALLEEIIIETDAMKAVLRELDLLLSSVEGREPTAVEKAAAGAFLGQLYGGLENILKRFCRHTGVPLPGGPQWHQNLLLLFGDPPARGLPKLFTAEQVLEMDEYRRFRHLFVHGYSILLDWSRVQPLATATRGIFERFLTVAQSSAGT